MAKKNYLLLFLSIVLGLVSFIAHATISNHIRLETHFTLITGKPTWLLIIRNIDTGEILPYLYDIRNNDDFWLAFSYSRNYQIIASTLKFGPYAIINNFCHLENRVLSGESLDVNLKGLLTPIASTSECYLHKFKE